MYEGYVLEKKSDLTALADEFRWVTGKSEDHKFTVLEMADILNKSFTPTTEFTFSASEDYCIVIKYNGESKNVHIPPVYDNLPVTRLNKKMFVNDSGAQDIVETISIPSTITYIAAQTFSYCSKLTSIVLPTNVETLATGAFANCDSLEKVVFLGTPDSLFSNAFFGAPNLSDIYVPWAEGVKPNAPWGAPENVSIHYSYSSIEDLPATIDLTTLLDKSITELYIPDGVKEIGPYAFYGCEKLSKVYIPASVTTIDKNAFTGCLLLETIEFAEGFDKTKYDVINQCLIDYNGKDDDGGSTGVTVIFGGVLAPSLSTSINIPNGVETIGQSAFLKSKIVTVTLPATVKTISDSAFRYCENLLTVDMSAAPLEVVGGWAFADCTSLKTVCFPTTPVLFWDKAFMRCSALTGVDLSACPTKHIPHGMFADCVTFNESGAPIGGISEVKLPDTVEFIEEAAFKSCCYLKTLEIPKNCRFIGHQAFAAAHSLNSLTFAEGSVLESIGEDAFYDTRVLKTVEFPASLSTIEKYAFRSYLANGKLETVKFPSNSTLSVIGEGAFQDQYNINTLELPKTLSEIGAYAFANLQNLSVLNLDNNVNVLETETFANCARLTSLTLPKGLKEIKSKAFKSLAYYTTLPELNFPVSLHTSDGKNIADDAFTGGKITTLNIPWAYNSLYKHPWGASITNTNYDTILDNSPIYVQTVDGSVQTAVERNYEEINVSFECVIYLNGNAVAGTTLLNPANHWFLNSTDLNTPELGIDLRILYWVSVVPNATGGYTYTVTVAFDATAVSNNLISVEDLKQNYTFTLDINLSGGSNLKTVTLNWEE